MIPIKLAGFLKMESLFQKALKVDLMTKIRLALLDKLLPLSESTRFFVEVNGLLL